MKTLKPLLAALPLLTLAAPASAADCDRACLRGLGDRLLDSMLRHAPFSLPLASTYAATENSVGSSLGMMTIWRTTTAVQSRYFAIDTASQQVFFSASVREGRYGQFVFGRFKIADGKFSEIEIYVNRSRSVGGFMFGANGPASLPPEWRAVVPQGRVPPRSDLLTLGQAAFGTAPVQMRGSNDCILWENGAAVAELPEVAAKVAGGPPPSGPPPSGRAFTPNADGTLPIPCGLPPIRPQDPTARTDIVDEVQGVVVSMGVTHGHALPYLASNPSGSAFVPTEIEAPFIGLLKDQQAAGLVNGPAPRTMPVSGATFYVFRVYDGAIQGMQLLVNLGAPGGRSPWVAGN